MHTFLATDGQHVCTEVRVPQAALGEQIARILEPGGGEPESLSPLRFEWGLAQETVRSQYNGSLTWDLSSGTVRFLLDLPLNGRP